jgi:hypothetical protein
LVLLVAAILPVRSLTIADKTKKSADVQLPAYPVVKDGLLLYQKDVRLILDQGPVAFQRCE